MKLCIGKTPFILQLINSNMLVNPAMTGRFDGQASGRFIQLAETDYAEMPYVYAFSEIKLGRVPQQRR